MDTAIVIGGGQSGLSAAFALRNQGFRPVVLEAGAEPVGSWPRYYDSLRMFTPARFSRLPGMPFPGPATHYPARDEVVDYLRSYAARLDCEIRTGHRVRSVLADRDGHIVETTDGARLHAPVVVAATGNFDRPHRPAIPGLESFTGTVLHSSEYRSPAPFAGQRVVVVGGGSSAVQIAIELAGHTRTTLATRGRIGFTNQLFLPDGDFWWRATDAVLGLPVGPLLSSSQPFNVVPDYNGAYRAAIKRGEPDHRPMFAGAAGPELLWADGRRESVDTIILGTGYRPALEYLRPIGALDRAGLPRQRHGLSTVHPGLAYVGVDGQHTLLSNALHGVGRDAAHIARRLRRRIARTAPALRRAAA